MMPGMRALCYAAMMMVVVMMVMMMMVMMMVKMIRITYYATIRIIHCATIPGIFYAMIWIFYAASAQAAGFLNNAAALLYGEL